MIPNTKLSKMVKWGELQDRFEANATRDSWPDPDDTMYGVPFKWFFFMPRDQYAFDKKVPEDLPGAMEWNEENAYSGT